jgi:hypothetical protein
MKHEGKQLLSNQDLSNTPLSWVDLTSNFPGVSGRSGAAIFIHPSHPDYPPTWLTRSYGPQCVGWPGVEPHTLNPGSPVELKYRFWFHGDEQASRTIDQRYSNFVKIESGMEDDE